MLEAFDRYPGTILDCDSGASLDNKALRGARERLELSFKAWSGDIVLLRVKNSPAFPIALFAAVGAGANPLVLPGDVTEQEVARLSAQFCAVSVVTDDVEFGQRHFPASVWQTDVAGRYPLRALRVSGMDGSASAPAGLRGVPLHPTSGTTSAAKVAVRPANAAVEEARHYIETLGIDRADMTACTVPMSHAYGFGMGMMVSLLSGAGLKTFRTFNPRMIARLAKQEEITILPIVPGMLPLLGEECGSFRSSLRYVLSAGSPLDPSMSDDFLARTGHRPCSLYGTTETGGISINTNGDPMRGVGPAMRGVEIRHVADADDDYASLSVKSSSMMAGYLTAHGIDRGPIADGWFATGDVGKLVEGDILLKGRSGDVINVRGMKVLSAEIEDIIMKIPGVEQVKVYAGVDDRNGETVRAAIVASHAVDEIEVRRFCLTELSPSKCPSKINFLRSLPRTASGKISIPELPGAKATSQ